MPSEVVQDFIDYQGMTAAALRAMAMPPCRGVVSKGIEAALAGQAPYKHLLEPDRSWNLAAPKLCHPSRRQY